MKFLANIGEFSLKIAGLSFIVWCIVKAVQALQGNREAARNMFAVLSAIDAITRWIDNRGRGESQN